METVAWLVVGLAMIQIFVGIGLIVIERTLGSRVNFSSSAEK